MKRMDRFSTESESDLSLDSLEEEPCKSSSKIHTNIIENNTSNLNEVTVPFCRGDVLLQAVQKPLVKNPTEKLESSVPKDTQLNKISKINNAKSDNTCLFQAPPLIKCQSARVNNRARLSRTNHLQTNCDRFRPRNVSVSYLEQYRKKMYGISQENSSISSVVGSSQEQSMSYVSFVSAESKTGSSESEFYLDLVNSMNTKELTRNNQEEVQLVSPTLPKPKKANSKNEEVPKMIVTIRDVQQECKKKDLEKRKSLEKREAYASQVNLRNRINICQQKRKEKLEQKSTDSDNFYQTRISQAVNSTSSCNELPPFLSNQQRIEDPSKTRERTKKKMPSKKLLKNEGINKKSQEMPNITVLQQRHAVEKNLVNSIKTSILKR